MATASVMGHEGKWSFAASNAAASTTTFSGSTLSYAVVSDTVGLKDTLGYSRGLRGIRGQVVEGSRKTSTDISGTIVFEVSPKWLDLMIPYITSDTTTPFVFQETLTNGFDYIRYDGIAGKSRRYNNCQINQATLSFNGEFVTMSLDVVALTETEVTYAGAALGTDITWEPYIPAELVFAAGSASATRNVESLTLTMNNNLQARRRMKLAPQCYLPGIRTITLATDAEWGSVAEAEMYGQIEDGYAASLTLTRESMNSVLTFNALQIPDRTPGITGPDEMLYPIQGFIRGTGVTADVSWTNDSTN